ncbi:MAG: outer membrane beta-barrel protein [Ginsengibacter sp.]
MEENFYLDDFELTLQEQANQFKMVPNKKVWHGIYNDLHPGRRWPSVMVSLVLISSIVFIGYINSHSDKAPTTLTAQATLKNAGNSTPQLQVKPLATTTPSAIQNSQTTDDKAGKTSTGITSRENDNNATEEFITPGKSFSLLTPQQPVISANHIESGTSQEIVNVGNSQEKPALEKSNSESHSAQNLNNHESFASSKNDEILVITEEENEKVAVRPGGSRDKNLPALLVSANESYPGSEIFKTAHQITVPAFVNFDTEMNKFIVIDSKLNLDKILSSTSEQSQTTTAALAVRKKNDKISWSYYAGALINTVSFSGVALKENTNSNLSALPQVTQKDMKVIRNAALGFEAGLQMNYAFTPRLQFTTGARLTRSGYNIVSNLVHPTLATLTLRNTSTGEAYSRNFVTHYGDGTGLSTVSLHNYSYQASVPVGLQYMMWKNDKLQLNLAASVEPSMVFQADAYLLSADGKNYVNVPDLLRKWNLSSSFTPSISFRSHKLKWSIGPDLRYQWLSTYQKNYTIKEHLIDYGIRIGISK